MLLFSRRRCLVSAASLVCLAGFILSGCDDGGVLPQTSQTVTPGGNAETSPGSAKDYLFCLWNVENLFDDKNDGRNGQGDKEYDAWLSSQPDMLRLKLSKLTDALLEMNGGKGPDILAVVEVESVRAAELLKWALNSRLADPSLHYQHVLMKEVAIGRHIAPAIITRLPVVADRTRQLGARHHRILEGRVVVDGQELIVVAAHWTSRLREENVKQRLEYGDKIHGAMSAIYHANPAADFLVCGDFNDTPQDPSVAQRLRAVADSRQATVGASQLTMLNLFGDKAPAVYGTHNHNGRWYIFDQIAVSPGMLDSVGWNVDPASARTVKLARPDDAKGRPWRFGDANDTAPRGYSDHFPVTARLRVVGP
jgi:endonuclease/exonuclease/phosphatase family metal-dependent hydrolase